MSEIPAAQSTAAEIPAAQSTAGVWLVIGAQAAGKTTVADLLARQFERGVHVRGGQFYRWAVSGWAHWAEHAGGDRAAEARRLLDLRYRLSARTADEYCAAGFVTVVQDNLFGADVTGWLASVAARPRHLVVLRPPVAVLRAREAARHAATGKTAYRPGEFTPEDLDGFVAATPRTGLWLDTSAQTPPQTVAEILRRQPEAVVDARLPRILLLSQLRDRALRVARAGASRPRQPAMRRR